MTAAKKYLRHVNIRIPPEVLSEFEAFCYNERRLSTEAACYLIELGLHAFHAGVRIPWNQPPKNTPQHRIPPSP